MTGRHGGKVRNPFLWKNFIKNGCDFVQNLQSVLVQTPEVFRRLHKMLEMRWERWILFSAQPKLLCHVLKSWKRKSNREKILALCMAMLLSLAMLAGCSSADPNHPYEKEPLPANNSEAEPEEETSSVPLFELL